MIILYAWQIFDCDVISLIPFVLIQNGWKDEFDVVVIKLLVGSKVDVLVGDFVVVFVVLVVVEVVKVGFILGIIWFVGFALGMLVVGCKLVVDAVVWLIVGFDVDDDIIGDGEGVMLGDIVGALKGHKLGIVLVEVVVVVVDNDDNIVEDNDGIGDSIFGLSLVIGCLDDS